MTAVPTAVGAHLTRTRLLDAVTTWFGPPVLPKQPHGSCARASITRFQKDNENGRTKHSANQPCCGAKLDP